MSGKPPLFLVAHGFHPRRGSEPGKGYAWARALDPFFELHIFSHPQAIAEARETGLCGDWRFYRAEFPPAEGGPRRFYAAYVHWARAVVGEIARVRREVEPVGLHHVTMGSFRVLPRYDRLGIPYILGPLGGGETAPPSVLRDAYFPPLPRFLERARPFLNRAMASFPPNARVLSGARLALATTRETEAVLRAAGASRTAVVFPDVFEPGTAPDEVRAGRRAQAGAPGPFRLVWGGRFLWWKGGQIAVDFLAALRRAGIDATLDVFSDGPGIEKFRRYAAKQGGDAVRFHGLVPRPRLLEAFRESHLFVFPSLHESGSTVVLEAYAAGLPSLTLGIGGLRACVSPEAGLNRFDGDLAAWLRDAVDLVSGWRREPDLWLRAVEAALARSGEFSAARLRGEVARHVVPVFSGLNGGPGA